MTNNLRRVAQDLRTFAKRTKDFKYTNSALITFMLTKMAFAANNDTGTQGQVKQINTSINQLKTEFKKARKETDKLINGSNLELIQLMEQGEHVTKSPWSSWQIGAGYTYSNSNGRYKGYGTKKSNENKKYERLTKLQGRYKQNYQNGQYGTTDLNLIDTAEPMVEISIEAGIRPKDINKQVPTFTPNRPAGNFPPFNPRQVAHPKTPSTITVDAITPAAAPEINYVGQGIDQNDQVQYYDANGNLNRLFSRNPHDRDNQMIAENFQNYSTVGHTESNPFLVEMGDNVGGTRWTGNINFSSTNEPTDAGGATLRNFDVNLSSGSASSKIAFLSNNRDQDISINGNYKMVYTGGAGFNMPIYTNITDFRTKMFDTLNPSGRGGWEFGGAINWQGYTANRTKRLNGTLELHGSPNSTPYSPFTPTNSSGILNKPRYELLVGFEIEYFDSVDSNPLYHSIFENNGKIKIAGGYNVIGILIGQENMTINKKDNHEIKNNGSIIINGINGNTAKNSIGIDFSEFYNWDNYKTIVDLSLGDIILGKNSANNYGFRMSNIFTPYSDYYDDVTVSSGGADKKILVGGKDNVGIAIGKSLTPAANPYTTTGNLNADVNAEVTNSTGDNYQNPIANYFGLNVTLGGETDAYADNVTGFLRLADYSTNNTNDFKLNSRTMGTFDIADYVKDSYLIRTDKYGIQVNKDITTTTTMTGDEITGTNNIVMLSYGKDQHIYNYKTTTTGKNLAQTKGMVAVRKPGETTASTITNILNDTNAKLVLNGKESIGMYAGKGTKGENKGTISVNGISVETGSEGVGKNVGIYNEAEATFEGTGTVNVTGGSSSGIYNKGIFTVTNGNLTVNAKKGATGIFAIGDADNVIPSYITSFTFSSTNPAHKVKVEVDDTDISEDINKGVGVYAKEKATIDIQGAEINVTKGAAGIVADGGTTANPSKIDIRKGKITYSGDGYALFVKGNGKIDARESEITLKDKATGFRVLGTGNNITFGGTNKTTINVYSDDATVMTVSNRTTPVVFGTSTTESTLTSDLLGAGLTDIILDNVDGATTYKKYKIATLEGLSAFNIDTDIDRSLAADDNNYATKDFILTRRLNFQRSKVNIENNRTINTVLSGTATTAIGLTTPVGIDISSSNGGTGVNDTEINLKAGAVINSDRTDATGNGAVGAYINFGKITTDTTSTINVEKESNTVNENGVGIYATNGSIVNNAGTINVGGKNATGILGLAYRTKADGSVVQDNFKDADDTVLAGQGKITVSNSGNINLDGENAAGIYIKNNNASGTATDNTALNIGTITLAGIKSIGISTDKSTATNIGTININGDESIGLYGNNGSNLENGAGGKINLINSASADAPNIGIFTTDSSVTNSGEITGGNNTYGIYAKDVTLNGKVKVGNKGVGMYSSGNNVILNTGSRIEVGQNEAVGVFTAGTNTVNVQNNASNIVIGDGSYGFVLKNTTVNYTGNTANVTLGNDSVFLYSSGNGTVENGTNLTATGKNNYGLYTSGTTTNLGNIDFGSGTGNVAIYASQGYAKNGDGTTNPTITVSGTDKTNPNDVYYGIGMAAGYQNSRIGTIENFGTIKVSQDDGIGMYASGNGSKAINRGTIELSGKRTTGMYLDNGAIGENHGTIKTVPNTNNDGIVGVIAINGSILKNYGHIIIDAPNSVGVYHKSGTIESEGNIQVSGTGSQKTRTAELTNTTKSVRGITIRTNPVSGTATIIRNGVEVPVTRIDTLSSMPNVEQVRVGNTILNISDYLTMPNTNLGGGSSELGMYVDTSGVNFTNPIQGLSHLTGLSKINLIFGVEASRYTDAKDIEIGQNIITPYNEAILEVARLRGNEVKWSTASSSLTWIATPTQNNDQTIAKIYLSKIPYTSFAKDEDTYSFMDGLEQRYGVEGRGSLERRIFEKLNDIGKGEAHIFAQAVDEMKGHQYANIQQRTYSTGKVLDNEIGKLSREWRNTSRSSNKMTTFGAKDEYNTNTAGIIDYTSSAFGFAYIHENETVKLGNGSGWYAGAVNNRFKFKDIGKSKETHTMLKAGMFRSKAFDHNNSLNWTVSGEGFVSRNEMDRKYLVVDQIFNAKSDYTVYGAAVKNEISKTFRTGEKFSVRPYGSLKLEYGRFNRIKEESGQMRLEVKGNDYISVKPETGVEFRYVQPMAVKTTFVTSLGLGYGNELGRVSQKNSLKVKGTNAGWYNLKEEKEDRKGSFKADLNIGVENQRFGVTVNAGYDTKGKNARGGVGFRVMY